VILKGRCRAHGSQLARYLFAAKNDEVKVLEIRGTLSCDLNKEGLIGALKEFDEYAKLTKGEKTIFHLAIAPSDFDRMDTSKWQHAVGSAERALGLEGQPRTVVMHTYQGKDHLHVAWSRVDLETHKLKSDSFTNIKLVKAAREVELDLGLMRIPERNRGMEKAKELDRTLHGKLDEQKRQEKNREERTSRRQKKESQREREVRRFQEQKGSRTEKQLHRAIASSWHQSENGREFQEKLAQHGLQLVRGNRGPVVMDEERNVYSPARYIEDARVKDIKEKCEDIVQDLPTVDQARDPSRPILSPRKAQNLIRRRLRIELANDPSRPPSVSYDLDDF